MHSLLLIIKENHTIYIFNNWIMQKESKKEKAYY